MFIYKILKTIILFPFIILSVIIKNLLKSANNIFHELKINTLDILTPLKNIFKFPDMGKILNHIIKLVIATIFLLINSLIIAFIIYKIVQIPLEQINTLNFTFNKDHNRYLSTDIVLNCESHKYEDQCIQLSRYYYNINLDLELIKKTSLVFNNIEIEITANTFTSSYTIKKLIYIEGDNRLVEIFTDVVKFPLRLFGYYDTKHFNIPLLVDYNNKADMLDNLIIVIKDHNVNIKEANIILTPQINILRIWIYKLRYFILIFSFFGITFSQIIGILKMRLL